jgi:hypothetical protein
MYRKLHSGQISIEEFHAPFGGTLDLENRWVLFSSLIPREELEETFAPQSSTTTGAPAVLQRPRRYVNRAAQQIPRHRLGAGAQGRRSFAPRHRGRHESGFDDPHRKRLAVAAQQQPLTQRHERCLGGAVAHPALPS